LPGLNGNENYLSSPGALSKLITCIWSVAWYVHVTAELNGCGNWFTKRRECLLLKKKQNMLTGRSLS